MFRKEDYLAFDKYTNENFTIVSIHMDTEEGTKLMIRDNHGIQHLYEQERLHIMESVVEISSDECGNMFHAYEWDVVRNNRTGKMYQVLNENLIIELDDTFETVDMLCDNRLDMLEEDVFTRLGNLKDKEFEKWVEQERMKSKIKEWKNQVQLKSVINTIKNNREYRYMVVEVESGLGKLERRLLNVNTGCIVPTFVGNVVSETIDFLISEKHEIKKVESIQI